MLQRLGLASALLEEVPLLILDEPTLNLDPQGIDSLHRALADLKERGSTIVFSSHSIHTAVRLADRVGVLVAGDLVTVDTGGCLSGRGHPPDHRQGRARSTRRRHAPGGPNGGC